MAKTYFDKSAGLTAALQGIPQAAQSVANVHNKIAVMEYNDALTSMNSKMTALRDSFQGNTDYANYVTEFEKQAATIQYEIENSLKTAAAKREFTSAWGLSYDKAHGQITALAEVRSSAHLYQNTLTNIERVISTYPEDAEGILDPAAFLDAQRDRIDGLIANAVSNGMQQAEAEELHRNGLSRLQYNTARDFSHKAIDLLTAQGYSVEDADNLLTEALRLEGPEYQAFLDKHFPGDTETPTAIQQLARAYGKIDLSPEQEESLIAEMHNQVVNKTNDRERQLEAAREDYRQDLMGIFLEEGGWKELENNSYAMVAKDGLLSASEQGWWRNQINTQKRIDEQIAEDARIRQEREDDQERWQEHDTQLEMLDAVPTREGISDLRARFLEETNDTARRIRLGQLKVIERQLDYDEDQSEASKAALNLEEEKLRIDIEIDRLRGNPYASDALEELKSSIWVNPVFANQEQDRNERVDDINDLLDELDPTRRDPLKTDPEVLAQVFDLYMQKDLSDDDYVKKVLEFRRQGLSTTDSHTWSVTRVNDNARRKALQDTVALDAAEALGTFFKARIAAAATVVGATNLTREYAASLGIWDSTVNNPEILNLEEGERRRYFDDIVDSVVDRIAARSVIDQLLDNTEPTNSLQTFQDLKASGNTKAAEELGKVLRGSWEDDFWDDNIVRSGDFTREDFEWIADQNGDLVYRNKESGNIYTKRYRSDIAKITNTVAALPVFRFFTGAEKDTTKWVYARAGDYSKEGNVIQVDTWRDWQTRNAE